jgi:hypothetical protein
VAHFCTRIQFVVHERLQPGHNFFTEQLRVVSSLHLGLASFMPYAVQLTVIAGVALLPISEPQLSVQRETWPPVPVYRPHKRSLSIHHGLFLQSYTPVPLYLFVTYMYRPVPTFSARPIRPKWTHRHISLEQTDGP